MLTGNGFTPAIEETIQSWNIGGSKMVRLGSYLESLHADSDPSVVLLQELPKGPPGCQQVRSWGKYSLVSSQPRQGCRGTGVAFHTHKWCLLRRKASGHGTWFQLQHTQSQRRVWFGSGYFSTGVDKDSHATEVQEMLEKLPATADMVVLGSDCNTSLNWVKDGETSRIAGHSSKTQNMLGLMASRRLEAIAQADVTAPTWISRKSDSVTSQIDCLFSNRPGKCSGTVVSRDSRKIVGTDHEQLSCTILLQAAQWPRSRRGAPRMMRSDVTLRASDVETLDQDKIQTLADKFTCRRPAVQFHVPDEIRKLGARARASREPQDWICYCRRLREARVEWKETQYDAASKNWGSFRWAKKQRTTRWQECFASSQVEHPRDAIEKHLRNVFAPEKLRTSMLNLVD